MSKKNRKRYPRKQKYKNLKYQIKEVELARLEKANIPMLTQTEKQYRNHAIKFAKWCKEQYGCRMLEECSAHVQDYADFLVAQGKSPSTIHTYLAGICRICGVPLADIQKPIRVVAENTRSRGMKAVDSRTDSSREASPRLYDFARIVGIRRAEYLHLAPNDLVTDDFGNWCIRVKKGKGGKRQLQRILPEELPAIKAVFDAPTDDRHLFSREELKNKIDLHHLRALRAQKMYRYYLDKIVNTPGYREQLIAEIRHTWEHDDVTRKENGYRAKRWSDMKVTGNYVSRGNNRKLAQKHGLPLQYDRLALLAVSIFHLSHWRHDVTVANYLLAV